MRAVTTRGLLFLLLALCGRASWAQVPTAPVPADLDQAIRTRDTAVVKADFATWDRLTTPDFTVVTKTGTLVNKAVKLATLRKQRPEATQAERTEQVITVYGASAVRRMKVNDDWVMELWVKDAQGWRAAGAQFTPAF